MFTHEPAMPVSKAIESIYEDFSRNDLLQRCLGAFNQNNNESFNQLFGKSHLSQYLAVSLSSKLPSISLRYYSTMIMSHFWMYWNLNIQIGQAVYDYCIISMKNACVSLSDRPTLTRAKVTYALELLLASTKKHFLMQKGYYMVQGLPNNNK